MIYCYARDNLFKRGESASKMLILSPLNGFLSRSLFHSSPLSLGKRAGLAFPTISGARYCFAPSCAASWERAALHRAPRGLGKQESGGLGEKTQKGKGDCSCAAPLSLGCLPKLKVKRSCVNAPKHQQPPPACAMHPEHQWGRRVGSNAATRGTAKLSPTARSNAARDRATVENTAWSAGT